MKIVNTHIFKIENIFMKKIGMHPQNFFYPIVPLLLFLKSHYSADSCQYTGRLLKTTYRKVASTNMRY